MGRRAPDRAREEAEIASSSHKMIRLRHLAGLFAILMLAAAPALGSDESVGWMSWGGDPGGQKFSPLKEITPDNVGNLVRAFEYHTGDLATRPPEVMKRTKFETTPAVRRGQSDLLLALQ